MVNKDLIHDFSQIALIIPSYNPNGKLLELIEEIENLADFKVILVVNDGSDLKSAPIFKTLSKCENVHIINHSENRGKGQALKTGFLWCLQQQGMAGAITADSDGQHSAGDIVQMGLSVADKSYQEVTLGSRKFTDPNVPWKSKFGNVVTARLISITFGYSIRDSQTGLRFFPYSTFPLMTKIKGNRFEYEMNVILLLMAAKQKLVEIEIETIYNDKSNSNSHFRPIIDSIKIFSLILKFAMSSAASFLIDITAFAFILSLLAEQPISKSEIFISTIAARIISVSFNYLINKKLVFKKPGIDNSTIQQYFMLVIGIMLASSVGSALLFSLIGSRPLLVKIFIDLNLFVFSFWAQREWVFVNKEFVEYK